jgi:23S rRNA (pseudouridine1915-N3)-methyltransferase
VVSLTVISVGPLKDKFFVDAAAEYEKRLSSFCRVENVVIKEEKIQNEDNPAEIAEALETEGRAILARIPKGAHAFALCVEGREYDSPALAERIGTACDSAGKICFVIGSSHGLADSVKRACDERISLSRLTLPHRLAKIVLLEAIYRSFAIRAGKRYHK